MEKKYTIIIVAFITAFLLSCTASKSATKTTTETKTITYTTDVRPIVDEYCGTKCHSAEKKAGGIDLSTYTAVKHEGIDGDLLGAIQHGEGFKPMPKNGDKLSDANIQLITNWVHTGAAE